MNYNLLKDGKEITRIDVSFGKIKTLPILPLCLEVLIADNNLRLESLPATSLPLTLRVLSICLTGIQELAGIPETLEELYVSENPGLQLGETLPANLKILVADSCELETLPCSLPPRLTTLSVDGNYLQTLPELPWSIETVIASNNQLVLVSPGTCDFSVYRNWKVWLIQNNVLRRLPWTLPPFLVELNCAENNLKRLPMLPETLVDFVSFGNPWVYEFHQQPKRISARDYVNGVNRFVRFMAKERIGRWILYRWFRKSGTLLVGEGEEEWDNHSSTWGRYSKTSFSSLGSFLSVSSVDFSFLVAPPPPPTSSQALPVTDDEFVFV